MDVSENNGIPKSSILIGFSIIFTIHLGGFPPIFGSTPIWKLRNGRTLQFDLGQKAQLETPLHERDFWLVCFFCFFGEVFLCQHIRGIDRLKHSSFFKEKWRLKCMTRGLPPKAVFIDNVTKSQLLSGDGSKGCNQRCFRVKDSGLEDMDVSENSDTPKSSILIGFSIMFTIHFGGFPPIFGSTPI